MDTELAEKLMTLAEGVARIDERTIAIHENQDKLGKVFEDHVEDDKTDFKEVNGRITKVSNKQNWIIGAGSVAGVLLAAATGAIMKNVLGG
jgi:hypothetical protein